MKHLKHLYANHSECSPAIKDGLVMSGADCPWCAIAASRGHYPGVQAHLDGLRARAAAKSERKAAA